MANVKLTDNFGLNLDLIPDSASALSKYFKNVPNLHAAGADLASLQNVALKDFPLQSASIGLSVDKPVEIGTTATEMTIGGGVSGNLAVRQEGQLFDRDRFGDPITILPTQAYLSIGMTASLSPGLTTETAQLSFGFAPGTTISFTSHRPFTTTSSEPRFSAALAEALRAFSIPATIEDLKCLAAGTVVTVEGAGTLKF